MASAGNHTGVSRLPQGLGDGLVLRAARHQDGPELADFNATMHADIDLPASALGDWTHDLFDLPHPTFEAERDVTVVEDTATGRIVSALFLIPQVWSYAGVALPTGQPELIATHPDYRNRGLVRAQFGVVHEWSRAAGHLWQFISGIPWYYRQFGYAFAIDLAPRPHLWLGETTPEMPDGLSLRPAAAGDLGFLAATEAQATSGTVLGPWRGERGFALELARRPGSLLASAVLVIESRSRGPIGYLAHPPRLNEGSVPVRAIELRRGEAWLAPTQAVIAHLHDWVRHEWVRAHPSGAGRGIRFALPDGHPALRCLATRLGAGAPGTYGLYARVPDLVAFVQAIAPALEARLACSPAVGWSGDLHLDLYTTGLHLAFHEGRLTTAERWTPRAGDPGPRADGRLPVDCFLAMLLGSRGIAELERTTADCLVETDTGGLLLEVLFPTMPTSWWEFC